MLKSIFNKKLLPFYFLSIIIVYGCSASTGSRYDKDENKASANTSVDENKNIKNANLKEDFDITPYKTEIVIPENKPTLKSSNKNVWFDYGSPEIDTKTKSLIGTANGYRVLVLTTDNIEEANQVKADVYFIQSTYEVYIDFEPPFYKVKTGDFDSQKTADDLRFKLNQLGYKEAKVITDKINIYK
ncbi:MAG: SPOR domain-containing protein [Ignavibacteriales bacterium]|nr:SPOR domain-containing protein [Ignavibacteriales bacterium]